MGNLLSRSESFPVRVVLELEVSIVPLLVSILKPCLNELPKKLKDIINGKLPIFEVHVWSHFMSR